MQKPLMKPLIIAICGKSATGKDTTARWLSAALEDAHIPTNIIVSDTTRPPRYYEEDGVDYNFLTETVFHNKINYEQYLEYSFFNGWFYGTDHNTIDYSSVNIGIFNIDGISSLAVHQDKYDIYCIYLKCNAYERIRRSTEREGKFRLEYIRRAIADNHDFKGINNILKRFSYHGIFDSSNTSIHEIIDIIIWQLKIKRLIYFT